MLFSAFEPRRYHLLNAISHATTYLMIHEGVIEEMASNN